MSINNYYLFIAENFSRDLFVEFLSDIYDAQHIDFYNDGVRVSYNIEGLLCIFSSDRYNGWSDYDFKIDQSRYINGIGFMPTHSICFDHNHKKDGHRADEIETRIVIALLKKFQGDAVMMFNMDCPRLIRRNGTLTLSTRDKIWWGSGDFDRADLFDIPYEIAELPYAL